MLRPFTSLGDPVKQLAAQMQVDELLLFGGDGVLEVRGGGPKVVKLRGEPRDTVLSIHFPTMAGVKKKGNHHQDGHSSWDEATKAAQYAGGGGCAGPSRGKMHII